MSDQQQLRQQREALAQAVNRHDVQAVLAFIHPSFVGKTECGFTAGYKEMVQALEQLCAPGVDYQETVEIEAIEVSGDSAKLVTRRSEKMERGQVQNRPRGSRPLMFLAILFGGMAILQIDNVGTLVWSAPTSVVCLCWEFYLRRKVERVLRYQETWRMMDGRWLLVEEQQRGASLGGACRDGARSFMKTPHILFAVVVAVVVVVAVGAAYEAWSKFTGPFGTPPEFQRSGNPALKLEVRRAATKEVDGWKPMTTPRFYYAPRWRPAREEVDGWKPTTPDERQGKDTYYVSPEVELSNEDVLSTRAHFTPMKPKAGSRWKGGVQFLVTSIVFFVVWRRSKNKHWGWGVGGLVFLLLGLGILWHGLTSTADWYYQRGIWQVVIRFNDAGKKKLALLAASKEDATNEQSNWYPSKAVVFLIDGEMNFVAPPHLALQSLGIPHKATAIHLQHHHSTMPNLHPVYKQDAEEVYYLYQVGLTEEDATRIAKGIVGP